MRNITQDPKYISANAIPFAFNEGDWVTKIKGYRFHGVILSCFRNRSGSPRYNVENDDGIIHIFNHEQLQLAP